MLLHVRRKAFVYCVDADRLLVFRHVGLPANRAGLQVPGGTLRDDEPAQGAALRELQEETGRSFFRLDGFLGVTSYNLAPYRQELQERYFFRARLTVLAPRRWRDRNSMTAWPRRLRSSSSGSPSLPAMLLAAGQGALLHRLAG